MEHHAEWLVENRILLRILRGELTLEEIQELSHMTLKYASEAEAPWYCIYDLSEVSKFPLNLKELRHHLLSDDPEGLDWTLLITTNDMVRWLINFLFRALNRRYRVVDGLDAAVQLLHEYDPSLDLTAHTEQ